MPPPTQLHLIHALNFLREAIDSDWHKSNIIAKAEEAYDLAFPVQIDPAFGYKIAGKERTLHILAQEIRQFRVSKAEVEVIKFQLSSSILMLMLQFIEGSLEELNLVLDEHRVKIA